MSERHAPSYEPHRGVGAWLAAWRAWVLATVCVLASSAASASSPFESFGVSAKDAAEGSAGVASPTDYSAVHNNPAGLTLFDRTEVSLGTRLVLPQLSVDMDRASPARSPAVPGPHAALVFGAVVPAWGLLQDRVYFGFGMSVPTSVLTRFRTRDPADPFFYAYDTATEHYETNAGVGIRVLDAVRFGIGFRLGAGQRGVLFSRIDPLRQRINEQVFDAWQYALIAPTAGAIIGPLRLGPVSLNLGASVRDAMSQPVEVPALISFDGVGADVFATLTGQSNYIPRTLAAGAALTLDIGRSVSLLDFIGPLTLKGAMWHQAYSSAPAPFLRIQARGEGEGLAALGLDDLLTFPGEAGDRVGPPGLVDIVQSRVALNFEVLRDTLTLRGAYGYRPTPVPDQTGATNIIGNNAHLLSAGVGLALRPAPLFDGTFTLDGAWQGQFLEPRRAEKVRQDDPVGSWTASGAMQVFTLALSYRF